MNRNPCNCTNTTLGSAWSDCWIKFEKKRWGCTFDDKKAFFKNSLLDKCEKYCPLECDSISYSSSVNSLPFQNFFELRIYYEDLKYTSITQIPKSQTFDLVSDIGGICGLFIGVSFVTLFEIGELLIEGLFFLFERKRKIALSNVSVQTESSELSEIQDM